MNNAQRQNKRALDRLEKQFDNEILRNYQIALKEIRAKIALADEKHGLEWTEMQRYNRLAKLEEEIGEEIRKLTGKNAQTLAKGQRRVYEESYYRTAYFLSNAVNTDLQYLSLNQDVVKKAIENPLDRVGFLQRNRDNHHQLTRQLKEQLTQGLIQGESYRSTAKRIKERMDVGASKALTISRTENGRVRSQAKLDSMEEGSARGIELKKQWLSTVDGDTRESHQDLDGTVVELKGEFEGEDGSGQAPRMMGSASEDINCRCEVLEIVDNFTPNTRRVRGVGTTEYKTYNEYKQQGLIQPK